MTSSDLMQCQSDSLARLGGSFATACPIPQLPILQLDILLPIPQLTAPQPTMPQLTMEVDRHA